MSQKAKILYVEDDASLSFVTKDHLELNGYEVTQCSNGKEGLDVFLKSTFDICVLDVMMPIMDGFTLAKEIRKINEEIPIIFLTAKSMKDDRIEGLTLGADDYLTKPFSIEELVLKIQVFLRRKHIIDSTLAQYVHIGKYEFDFPNLSLKMGDTEKILTQREAELLLFLANNQNQVVKRRDILERIWGENDYFLGRSMDVFISRLRKYLQEDESIRIENIHGVGFKLITH